MCLRDPIILTHTSADFFKDFKTKTRPAKARPSPSLRYPKGAMAHRRTLRHVSIITRHGDRTPTHLATYDPCERLCWQKTLPTQDELGILARRFPIRSRAASPPKNDELEGSEGRLTRRGLSQLRTLGKYLRQRYTGECAPRVISSNYARTQQSAQSLLSGYFHGDASGRRGIEISVPPIEKCVIDMFSRYGDIHTLAAELGESTAFRNHEIRHELDDVRRDLESMPLFEQNAFMWFKAVDILTCYNCHRDDVPAPHDLTDLFLDDNIFSKSSTYLHWRFIQYYSDQRIMDLATRDILASIAAALQHTDLDILRESASTAQENIPSMDLYSGHDVTILPLLMRLSQVDLNGEARNFLWPGYASHLQVESWSAGDIEHVEPIVVVRYINGDRFDEIKSSCIPEEIETVRAEFGDGFVDPACIAVFTGSEFQQQFAGATLR